jgi:ABC-type oligopeptide transport system substrate-binding subunit
MQMPADPAANTYGGAVVRSLIFPQLFRAAPDGKWQASLVQQGSDATRPGALSARFRLRTNARWSDGTRITVSDLRRTLDGRFVASIDEPTSAGTIVVHFLHPLPGWRRLWSGLETIAPPAANVFGGPYRLDHVTPGLETVLVANDAYYGTKPRIREVHLVLTPDAEIAARLMAQGDLDVVAPFAFTNRTERLRRIKDAHVVVGDARRGGWTATLVANPSRLTPPQRQALFALADAPRFADVLLHNEATATGKRTVVPSPLPAAGGTPAISAPLESAPSGLLLHAMQRAGHKAGRDFDLRQSEFDRVLAAYSSGGFDLLFNLEPGAPEPCWTCQYSTADAALATQADAHERRAASALQDKLVTDLLVLPLWRERPVAAVRDGLDGASVNGFSAAGPLWNLEAWRWKN